MVSPWPSEPTGAERLAAANPEGYPVKTCESCGAPIVWGWTETGEKLCLDAAPHERGTRKLSRGSDGRALALNAGPAPFPTQSALFDEDDARPRYRSHFSSCPNARYHSRSG